MRAKFNELGKSVLVSSNVIAAEWERVSLALQLDVEGEGWKGWVFNLISLAAYANGKWIEYTV
jgi:hypothetical protein